MTLSELFEIFAQSHFFNNIPVDTKESSIEDIISNLPNTEICHQQWVKSKDETSTVLICSEQKSSILSRNVFKPFKYILPQDQIFLLNHYLNVMRLSGLGFNNESLSYAICVNAYTHSYNTNYQLPNILLSGNDLVGSNKFQYSTQLYQIDNQFLSYMQRTDNIEILQQENDFANQIIPVKFLYKPSVSASLQSFLITGSADFIENNLKLADTHPEFFRKPKSIISASNIKKTDSIKKIFIRI